MFGLVEASAWSDLCDSSIMSELSSACPLHVQNGTIKMSGLLGSESEPMTVLFGFL